jgi:predicted O-methyltransferase YrrM
MRLLRHYFRARTAYDLQSPFAYAFARETLDDRRWYYVFSEAEALRDTWKRDKRAIDTLDLGAGGRGGRRKVADLARHSATPPLFCRWLFHIVRFVRPERMLEMGTSLGVSALYQSAAARSARFITLEGCPQTAGLARKTFDRMHCPVDLRQGAFDDLLPEALADLERLDYLFLDGDHSRAGTLRYLEQCLRYTHNETVWVIADIHWSDEMEKAWKDIQAFPGVTMTVDLFGLGVVFFRRELLVPAHLTLVPSLWKPWRLGRWGGL